MLLVLKYKYNLKYKLFLKINKNFRILFTKVISFKNLSEIDFKSISERFSLIRILWSSLRKNCSLRASEEILKNYFVKLVFHNFKI